MSSILLSPTSKSRSRKSNQSRIYRRGEETNYCADEKYSGCFAKTRHEHERECRSNVSNIKFIPGTISLSINPVLECLAKTWVDWGADSGHAKV